MILQAIPAASIRHSVADSLRTAMRHGHLKPGESLNEATLAAQLQVSRGPVREAFLGLVEEGLVTHAVNRGFAVINFTIEDRNNILAVRLPIETLALDCARAGATQDDLSHLEKLKDALFKSFYSDDPARDAAEIAFHGFICKLSRNPWLVRALMRVWVPYFTFNRHLGLPPMPLQAAVEQHQLYFDFIAKRTNRTADECVRFHLGLPIGEARSG